MNVGRLQMGETMVDDMSQCGKERGGEVLRAKSASLSSSAAAMEPLPPASPDPESAFGVYMNINISTIDRWLGRDDVTYREVRMLFDPAHYEDIGGSSELSEVLEGFKIVPYPYIATLSDLPVEGAYTGDTLYELTFTDDGAIASATPRYRESLLMLEELFPRNKALFLVCGAGGYAASMKALLVHLGWDERDIYNIGGMWGYDGKRAIQLIERSVDASAPDLYASWRADYAAPMFEKLHPITFRIQPQSHWDR